MTFFDDFLNDLWMIRPLLSVKKSLLKMNLSNDDQSKNHNFFEKLQDGELLVSSINQLENNQDYFEDIFPSLKKAWIIVYILNAIFCFFLAKIAWFERSGEAGPFRTLVNQLMSFNIDQVRKSPS